MVTDDVVLEARQALVGDVWRKDSHGGLQPLHLPCACLWVKQSRGAAAVATGAL